MKDSIKKELKVNAELEKAFYTFVKDFSKWYPVEYTWSQNVLEDIVIEGKEGGKCYETGPFKFRLDWGRVLIYEPPNRIAFTWQISFDRVPEPNPVKSSEVDIKFFEENEYLTRIKFEHRNFIHHGDDAEKYRKAMDSPEGWDYILQRYEEFLTKQNSYSQS